MDQYKGYVPKIFSIPFTFVLLFYTMVIAINKLKIYVHIHIRLVNPDIFLAYIYVTSMPKGQ